MTGETTARTTIGMTAGTTAAMSPPTRKMNVRMTAEKGTEIGAAPVPGRTGEAGAVPVPGLLGRTIGRTEVGHDAGMPATVVARHSLKLNGAIDPGPAYGSATETGAAHSL